MPQLKDHLTHLNQLIDQDQGDLTYQFLDGLDERDLLQLLDQLGDEEFQRLLACIGRQHLADLLADLDPEVAVRYLEQLEIPQAAALADRMDPDDAADLISEMGDQDAEQLLEQMLPDESHDVRTLLSYPPETAGGLMTPEFVAIPSQWTVRETIRYLRTQAHDAETIYYLYVVDEQQRLTGVLSLRDLILANDYDRIADVLNENVVCVRVDDDQEAVANLIMEEDLLALPVVDFNHRLVGIVTVDDILDVLEEEYSEDILKFSAIEGGEEKSLSPPAFSIRRRLPWLTINIGLSLIGAMISSLFEGTLQQFVALAFFLPVISNMGGNVGIQAVSVAIRGISTGEVSVGDFWRVMRKEIIVGVSNGLVLGGLLGVVSWFWKGSAMLGVVTLLGLWANVLVASLCGGTLPFLLYRLGLDPAMMTGPLLTTIVDVISISTFLGLGTVLLMHF